MVDWSITYFVCVKIEFQIPSRARVAQPTKGSRGLSPGEMQDWQGGDGVSAEREYTCFQQRIEYLRNSVSTTLGKTVCARLLAEREDPKDLEWASASWKKIWVTSRLLSSQCLTLQLEKTVGCRNISPCIKQPVIVMHRINLFESQQLTVHPWCAGAWMRSRMEAKA